MLVRLRHGYRQWLISGGYLVTLFVGAQIETPIGWLASAAVISLLALIAWIMSLRRARAIVDTPTSNIASAAQGYVEVIGTGEAFDGTPLMTPLRPMPCLWYRYKVECRRDNKWETESSGESTDSFLIDDGTGQCVVDPEGAEILPRDIVSWVEGDYRYTLATIVTGEQIYVLGSFHTMGGDNLMLDAKEDIKELLAEWKKDSPNLIKRFDLDGNGVLDMREWKLARAQARREVMRHHRELRAAPDTHMISQPVDGSLYLISTMPEETIARHYVRWAAVHVTIFLSALAGFAYIQQL